MQWSKEKKTTRKRIIDKTLQGKLKIEQHEPTRNPEYREFAREEQIQ
jgi:hypothetical protein